jgi:hypothetical protein
MTWPSSAIMCGSPCFCSASRARRGRRAYLRPQTLIQCVKSAPRSALPHQSHPRCPPPRSLHADEPRTLEPSQPAPLGVRADAELGQQAARQCDRRVSRERRLVVDGQEQGQRLTWQPSRRRNIPKRYRSLQESASTTSARAPQYLGLDLDLADSGRTESDSVRRCMIRSIIRWTGIAPVRHHDRVHAKVLSRR